MFPMLFFVLLLLLLLDQLGDFLLQILVPQNDLVFLSLVSIFHVFNQLVAPADDLVKLAIFLLFFAPIRMNFSADGRFGSNMPFELFGDSMRRSAFHPTPSFSLPVLANSGCEHHPHPQFGAAHMWR